MEVNHYSADISTDMMGEPRYCKTVAIIDDRSQIDKLISMIRKKQSENIEVTVVALNNDIWRELSGKGLKFKTLEDYGLSGGDLEEKTLKWFRSWSNTKVRDSKNIKELLEHESLSVWWLVDEIIYLSQFVFNISVRETLRQAIMFDHIISAENPSMVWCTRR